MYSTAHDISTEKGVYIRPFHFTELIKVLKCNSTKERDREFEYYSKIQTTLKKLEEAKLIINEMHVKVDEGKPLLDSASKLTEKVLTVLN